MGDEPKNGERPHILSVLACNVPGVLARVVSLFTGRGYNIDSLVVGHAVYTKLADRGPLSNVTIVSTCDDAKAVQIKDQIETIIDVI